jgi:dihydropteroate synthase
MLHRATTYSQYMQQTGNQQLSINCSGRLLTFEQPRIMGILNISPDSFYAGSRAATASAWLSRSEQLLQEGADILDIGGMSSRPGAAVIGVQEELDRVIPAIESIHRQFPEALLSVDTLRAAVAREAVAAGACIVNDISAGSLDADMYTTVADLSVPYVLMHMKGRPETMQQQAQYGQVSLEVLDFLAAELARLRALGIKDVIVDPGFGFGKTIDQNYELLRQLEIFHILEVPLLVGLSRKSMVYKVLGVSPEEALTGTSVLHWAALEKGAQLLRVHDVAAARQVVTLWQRMTTA